MVGVAEVSAAEAEVEVLDASSTTQFLGAVSAYDHRWPGTMYIGRAFFINH